MVLTPSEIDEMARSCPTLRDQVFIRVLYYTACRITELISILVSDVDLKNRVITIRHLKRRGKKYRQIPIDEETAKLLEQYIRGEGRGGGRLFPISREWGYQIVRDAAERIGLGGKIMFNPETGKMHYVHPHDLRCALATEWLTTKGDIKSQKELQTYLGHKEFSTTARYLRLAGEGRETMEDVMKSIREKIEGG